MICGCSDGTERTDGLHVMRQLRARGHEVTLFDLSMIPLAKCETLADARECIGRENLIRALEMMKRSDAIITVASEHNIYVPKFILELVGLDSDKENVGNYSVWDNCGVTCTVIANGRRRQRIAKELWAILNSSYDRLDVSDFLPFGRPNIYNVDPKLETAGPCVV